MENKSKIILVGLWNPQLKYINTRHNIGFDLVDAIIKKYNFKLDKKDKSKEIYKGSIKKIDCLFCKPQTYMNVSGSPIGEIVNFFKIPKSKILIIHDDLDLVVGKVKIKTEEFRATSEQDIEEGTKIKVTHAEGITLTVVPEGD